MGRVQEAHVSALLRAAREGHPGVEFRGVAGDELNLGILWDEGPTCEELARHLRLGNVERGNYGVHGTHVEYHVEYHVQLARRLPAKRAALAWARTRDPQRVQGVLEGWEPAPERQAEDEVLATLLCDAVEMSPELATAGALVAAELDLAADEDEELLPRLLAAARSLVGEP